MDFDGVLQVYGKENRSFVIRNLTVLGNVLFGQNKWRFTGKPYCEIGTLYFGDVEFIDVGRKRLIKNCVPEECNKAAYVLLVKDMYHEARHVWQHTKAWNDRANINSVKSYRQTTNIVRREFVKEYFPSAYYNNYSNDPSEMDAERFGLEMTLSYFKSEPIIDKQEAESILYRFMMADDSIHKDMLEKHRPKSIYDVTSIFRQQVENGALVKYPITDHISIDFENDVSDEMLEPTRTFLRSKQFAEYRTAFSKCETGIEQDKVMEQVILTMHPNAIRKAPLRICKELIDCRQQMEPTSLMPGAHAIQPKKINYSVQNIELTEEDVARISTNVKDFEL